MFRFAGIDLFLHWSWFLVAAYEINAGTKSYSSVMWNAVEYLALFLIVMLHEFSGLSVGWRMSTHRNGLAQHYGASRQGRW